MKITDKQYVVLAFLVICFVILSNAIIYKNVIDALYLGVLFISAIRMYHIEKRNRNVIK